MVCCYLLVNSKTIRVNSTINFAFKFGQLRFTKLIQAIKKSFRYFIEIIIKEFKQNSIGFA